MRIDNILVENYRCFKKYEISFATQTTVLIGKNGTGKTNLINALKKGVSFMFAKSQSFQKSLSESNNCNVRAFNLWDSRFDSIERGFSFPTKIDYNATFNNDELNWSFLKKKDPGYLSPTLYKNALNKVLTHFNQDLSNAELPVLAFFSDSYPHIKSNVGEKAGKLIKMDILPRDFAYYGWDEETNCSELWQRRYIKVTNSAKDYKNDLEELRDGIAFLKSQIENKDDNDKFKIPEWRAKAEVLEDRFEKLQEREINRDFQKEFEFINNRIYKFTEPLREDLNFINKEFQVVRISVNRPDRKSFSIEFSFSNGKSMFFEMLPQGYNRIFSIVFDIAYRSYILNPDKEPQGLVFIDEIELHLHPSLQQEVLQRLRFTFPKIQFIVSTHSPLIISNLKADQIENKVIRLENNGTDYFNETVSNIYGVDYTTSLMDVMETKYRPAVIDNLIDSYVILKIRNMDDDALKIWNEIFSIVGHDNEKIKKEITDKVKANS